MREGWHRYRSRETCAVCGHGGRVAHGSGCCYLGPVENPEMVLCLRIEKGGIKAAKDGMGWLHRMRENPSSPRPVLVPRHEGLEIDPALGGLAMAYQKAITAPQLAKFAESLGVSDESLRRLGVGWSGKAFSFPMRAAGNLVVGIRLRDMAGHKWATAGSRNGLFIARDLPPRGTLWIVEGPTDTAACLTMGLNAIGRPSNTAGLEFLTGYIGRFIPRRPVIILRNNDPEGSVAFIHTLAGAESLRAELMNRKLASSVEVVCPPAKDVRVMLNQGATRDDIEGLCYV